jgi:hypothetical protein
MCVKHGWAVVEADSESEAEEAAEKLPGSQYDWSDADDYQVVEEIDYE